MFYAGQEMLENSYSTAVRLMFGLPRETHRYLVEPLSGRNHLKTDLIKRFITFINQIKKTKKQTLIYVLHKIELDVGSITVRNLRKIMLRCGRNSVEDLKPTDCDNVVFREIPNGEDWRINMTQELIDVQNNQLEIKNFENDKIQEILTWIFISSPS